MLSKQNPCPVLIAHLFIFMVLGIEPKTLYMLGKHVPPCYIPRPYSVFIKLTFIITTVCHITFRSTMGHLYMVVPSEYKGTERVISLSGTVAVMMS
jgi:hypothetical protein